MLGTTTRRHAKWRPDKPAVGAASPCWTAVAPSSAGTSVLTASQRLNPFRRDTVVDVAVAAAPGFLITASSDGFVKFWKKQVRDG